MASFVRVAKIRNAISHVSTVDMLSELPTPILRDEVIRARLVKVPANTHSSTTIDNDTAAHVTAHSTESALVSEEVSARNEQFQTIEETIQLLFPSTKQANAYMADHPTSDFRFFVYNLTDHPSLHWKSAKECVESKAQLSFPSSTTRQQYLQDQICGFGATICNPTQQSLDQYSKRRLNRNVDVVLSQLLDEYDGPLRTHNPHEATLFIVTYPSTAWF